MALYFFPRKSMDCIFCKIIKKEIPAEIIFEDEKVLAFLDINPVNSGHTLVIPKEHYANMLEAPDGILSYIFQKSKILMQSIQKAMNADFVVVSVVGVDVPHFHIHLLPRYHHDGLANFWPTKIYKEGEMKEAGKKIRKEVTINP